MVIWEQYKEESNAVSWDETLLAADDYNVFQSYGWGEYKRTCGWTPVRYIARNKGGAIIGLVQFILKSLPFGLKMLWAAGGPVIRFKESGVINSTIFFEGLLNDLKERYPRSLIRFHNHIMNEASVTYSINQVLCRPLFKLNSGYSLRMNLSGMPDKFRQSMSSKHRYYTKKASKTDFEWRSGNSDNDINALLEVHKEMIESKGMHSIATSFDDIYNQRKFLGDSVNILTGFVGDIPVTSCLTLDFGRKSIYMVAATGNQGRKLNAAYAMVEKLAEVLRDKNIFYFDFGGIDPVSASAEGVNHFKRGFGGEVVEYVGEWETSTNDFYRYILNIAIWKRGG